MATRRYKINPGEGPFSVTEEAGAAVNSDAIELTVELANTAVNAASGTRSVTKEEVLLAIETIKNHIIKGNWLPA
jgi:hypothetical protein